MHYYKRQRMGKRFQLKEKTPISFRNRFQTPRQSWLALKQERRMGTLANQQTASKVDVSPTCRKLSKNMTTFGFCWRKELKSLVLTIESTKFCPTLVITTDDFMKSSDCCVSCLSLYRVARKKKQRNNKQWTLNTTSKQRHHQSSTKGHELSLNYCQLWPHWRQWRQ